MKKLEEGFLGKKAHDITNPEVSAAAGKAFMAVLSEFGLLKPGFRPILNLSYVPESVEVIVHDIHTVMPVPMTLEEKLKQHDWPQDKVSIHDMNLLRRHSNKLEKKGIKTAGDLIRTAQRTIEHDCSLGAHGKADVLEIRKYFMGELEKFLGGAVAV